jgi:hypothetical protein
VQLIIKRKRTFQGAVMQAARTFLDLRSPASPCAGLTCMVPCLRFVRAPELLICLLVDEPEALETRHMRVCDLANSVAPSKQLSILTCNDSGNNGALHKIIVRRSTVSRYPSPAGIVMEDISDLCRLVVLPLQERWVCVHEHVRRQSRQVT